MEEDAPAGESLSDLHDQLVGITIGPRLTWLMRGHDRMCRRAVMRCGVAILRRVTAADVPAREAEPEMDPAVTGGKAFLTARRSCRDRLYPIQM